MKTRFKTESGSTYLIDSEYKTWVREETGNDSGKIRTESGDMLEDPKVEVGEAVIILGPPINTLASFRAIITSAVVEKEVIE